MENDARPNGPPSSCEQQKLGSAEVDVALPALADQQERGHSAPLRKGWGSKPSPELVNRYPRFKKAPPKTNHEPQKSALPPKSNSEAAGPRPPRLNSHDYVREPPIVRLFKECEQAAHQFQMTKTRREQILIHCLQKAAELYEYGHEKDPEGYERLLAEHNIKITKRTSNPFTPVVKLVFHALEKRERTTLSRYASVLRYAQDHEYAPAEFPKLLEEDGGIEACVKQDRIYHASPERAVAIKRRSDHYESLKAAARDADFAAISDQISPGMSAVLVERDHQGRVRLLGIKKEESLKVRQYLPLLWSAPLAVDGTRCED